MKISIFFALTFFFFFNQILIAGTLQPYEFREEEVRGAHQASLQAMYEAEDHTPVNWGDPSVIDDDEKYCLAEKSARLWGWQVTEAEGEARLTIGETLSFTISPEDVTHLKKVAKACERLDQNYTTLDRYGLQQVRCVLKKDIEDAANNNMIAEFRRITYPKLKTFAETAVKKVKKRDQTRLIQALSSITFQNKSYKKPLNLFIDEVKKHPCGDDLLDRTR